MQRKFIPFENMVQAEFDKFEAKTSIPDIEKKVFELKEALTLYASDLKVEGAKILSSQQKIDEIILNINETFNLYLGLTTPPKENLNGFANLNKSDFSCFDDGIISPIEDTDSNIQSHLSNRILPDGSVAPPKILNQLDVDNFEKNRLIREMKEMRLKGQTISRSRFHHIIPLDISEFTEPFKYLENMNDYNGPFLVTLLKSQVEINNTQAVLQIDLNTESEQCKQGESILLSIYDITGSISKGEEKKFVVILYFNKFNGNVIYDQVIFMNRKQSELSLRQKEELKKFCDSKKILYETIH